jgi:hypothetical protein
MIQVTLADLFCIGIMAFGVGAFIMGPFLLAWLEERGNRYDRLPKFTTTEWEPSPYRFP